MRLIATLDQSTMTRRLVVEINELELGALDLTEFERAVLATPKEEGKHLSGIFMDLQIVAEAFERKWKAAKPKVCVSTQVT